MTVITSSSIAQVKPGTQPLIHHHHHSHSLLGLGLSQLLLKIILTVKKLPTIQYDMQNYQGFPMVKDATDD